MSFRAFRQWLVNHLGLLMMAAAAIAAPILFLHFRARKRKKVEQALAAIRLRGEPTLPADLTAPAILENENAAVLLEEAFWLLEANASSEPAGWSYGAWGGGGEPSTEDFTALLSLHADALELARKAVKRPRCRFSIDYSAISRLSDQVTQRLQPLRHLVRLFAAEADWHAQAGRGEEAAKSIACIFGLAHALDEEPILIAKLMQLAYTGIGLNSIERVAGKLSLSAEGSRTLLDALARLDLAKSMADGFVGERVLAFAISECVRTGRMPAFSGACGRAFAKQLSRCTVNYDDQLELIEILSTVEEASRLSPWEGLQRKRRISSRFGLEARNHLVVVLFGDVAETHVRLLLALAQRDATILGLACELFRSARGEYPNKLDDLAPEFLAELPPDPFTGKPFVYKLKPGSFVVYSLGDNLADDGGAACPPWDKGDIVWTGKAPPPAAGK